MESLYSDAEVLDGVEPKRYRIKDIEVHGVKLLDNKILSSSAGLNVGDSITLPSPFVATAIERMWATGRFSDVEVGVLIEGDDVTLDLILQERPRVFNWAVTGLPKGHTTDLTDKMKLKRNSELSDYVITKNKGVIKDFLADKGFRNADIDVRIENDTIAKNMVNVTFAVDRKSRVKIGEIVFEGNENISDKKLRSSFKKTHQKSINFFKSRKFKEADYEEDKINLIDYYNSKGYRNATILGDSIYDIDEETMGIRIKVSEGNKYYIRNITWIGNSKYETEQLERMFAVSPGDTYDKKSMYKRLGVGKDANPEEMSILSLYQNDGYLMSQIDPAEVIIGRDSIDLELKIFEGKPFTINKVNISGNLRVDDEVIRREVYTRPGELYNRSLLMQTIRTLGSMGHFNPEAIMPDIQPVSNSLVDVGWALEEQASDQFSVSGGWGNGSFVGSVGVTLNNVSIGDSFKSGAWRPYPMGKNQKLSIQAQSNGTYYKSLAASFTDPWLGGKRPNSFMTTVHYSDQNDAYYAWQESTMYFRTFGVSAGFGKRLSWPDPYFSIYGEASYSRYMLKEWSSFVMANGDANILSLKAVFSRNSVDQPLYPRRGSKFNASLQITPPYSLFDGKDYSDENMSDQDRYRFIEFHKWLFDMEWYQSFLSNSNLVLMLRANMGYLGSYNEYKTSPFERFEVGGDGMSGYTYWGMDIISVRGYEDGALDPSSDYSNAYNKYTMELRYPIILEPSSQIYVLGFLEGGNGFSSWRDFSPFNIKRSAGFGVRIYLPIVGMLGIDWAYGFDRATGDTSKSGSHFHFVMGQQF
ncbi:MAG: outer membrane protein assembly factor BamA [Rikenellaceae bacterium]